MLHLEEEAIEAEQCCLDYVAMLVEAVDVHRDLDAHLQEL